MKTACRAIRSPLGRVTALSARCPVDDRRIQLGRPWPVSAILALDNAPYVNGNVQLIVFRHRDPDDGVG